jgi:hypothetical protein
VGSWNLVDASVRDVGAALIVGRGSARSQTVTSVCRCPFPLGFQFPGSGVDRSAMVRVRNASAARCVADILRGGATGESATRTVGQAGWGGRRVESWVVWEDIHRERVDRIESRFGASLPLDEACHSDCRSSIDICMAAGGLSSAGCVGGSGAEGVLHASRGWRSAGPPEWAFTFRSFRSDVAKLRHHGEKLGVPEGGARARGIGN